MPRFGLPVVVLLVLSGCGKSETRETESVTPAAAAAQAAPKPGPVASATARGLYVSDERACAVGSDAKLYCWGRFEHVHALDGFPTPANVAKVFGDADNLCVIDDAGQARCRTGDAFEPRAMGEALQQIALGHRNAYGLRTDGQLLAWSLRDGADAKPWPVAGMVELDSIAATYDKVCASRRDESVVCAAEPDAEEAPRLFEVPAWTGAPIFGGRSQCAIVDGGAVSCLPPDGTWPDEDVSELFVPATVERAGRGATKVQSGQSFSCALLDDGKVRCWDRSKNPDDFPHPEKTVTDAVDLAMGNANACVRLRSGGVECWGFHVYRDPASPLKVETPTDVAGLAKIVELDVTQGGSCARDEAGTVSCWGGGYLLAGLTQEEGWHATPVVVAGLEATQVVVTDKSACARDEAGSVRCWGGRASRVYEADALKGATELVAGPSATVCGKAGTGWRCVSNAIVRDNPACYRPSEGGFRAPDGVQRLALGDDIACGTDRKGNVSCWGTPNRPFPAWPSAKLGECEASRLEGVSGVTQLAIGKRGGCAVTPKGTVCFSDGEPLKWSNDDAKRRMTTLLDPARRGDPIESAALGDVVDIGVGRGFSCALRENGTVACRGDNRFGAAGVGSQEHARRLTPVPIAGLP